MGKVSQELSKIHGLMQLWFSLCSVCGKASPSSDVYVRMARPSSSLTCKTDIDMDFMHPTSRRDVTAEKISLASRQDGQKVRQRKEKASAL